MVLPKGTQILGSRGRYRVDSVIGGGGMALVYSGVSDKGQRVVIKAPKASDDGKDNIRLEKIKVEAQVLKSLNHRNIVHFVDEKDEGDNFYLVLEMVNGLTLMDRFRNKPLDETTVRRFTLTILNVLKHIHANNIIHRDLNPKNIMLEPSNRLVVIDWGAAKYGWIQISSTVTQIGTPGWSAPEQFTTGQAVSCSDLYSLGAVAFFLLTGQEPRLYQNLNGGLRKSPCEVNSAVSEEMSTLVRVAMDQDPDKRYQTASDMISVLTSGKFPEYSVPHIVLRGEKYEVGGEIEIGRTHPECQQCKARGRPPEIAVEDSQFYISKHHLKLALDDKGKCSIEDLGSINKTAVSKDGGKNYRVLTGHAMEQIQHNDVVAIVYNQTRGPYMTFTYKEA